MNRFQKQILNLCPATLWLNDSGIIKDNVYLTHKTDVLSILESILGLYFLGKILLLYFSPFSVSMSLIAIVLGSNYLDYAAINGAMTHNGLFTIYEMAYHHAKTFFI